VSAPAAQLALVLHAHLPWVRQPDQERALEENWLHEAIADCYLPLIEVLMAAERRGSRFRLSLSLSPTLLTLLADPSLPARFLDYLERRWRLCAAERRRQRDPGRRALLDWYQAVIETRREQFAGELGGDLIAAWVALHDAGRVELLTTAATHGLAPLLRDHPGAVPAQLRVGRDAFRALTGREPAGLWLPECGYYPGLEREIAAAGYAYSLVETHGLAQAQPTPAWGVQAPVDGGGVAFFGRDPFSAAEVWSPTRGYPGHPDYREYFADLGLMATGDQAAGTRAAGAKGVGAKTAGPGEGARTEGDEAGLAGTGMDAVIRAALDDFLPPGVERGATGLGYYRVTGGQGPKEPYDQERAARRAVADAQDFVQRRRAWVARWAEAPPQGEAGRWAEGPRQGDASRWADTARRAEATRWAGAAPSRPPLTVAPYDAELFGHWWYEGPLFLAALGQVLDACPDLEPVTLGQHLRDHGCAGSCRVAPSTWGEAGYNATWLRPETAWVHLQLRQAAEEFQELRARYQDRPATSLAGRLLRQAARSLLLAQGSDWTFHLGRSGGSDFAQRQLQAQLARFAFLSDALRRGLPSEGCSSGQPCRQGQEDQAGLRVQKVWENGVSRDTGEMSVILETLAALERLDAVFPELDLDYFA